MLRKAIVFGVALLALGSAQAKAGDTLVYVADWTDQLGYVDLTTKATTLVGTMKYNGNNILFGDIGFSGGTLYGTSFPGASPNLYSINTSTGVASLVGALTGNAVGTVAAIVGDGSSLLIGYAYSDSIIQIDPNNLAAGGTLYATAKAPSSGDLAFLNGNLYGLITYDTGANNYIEDITTGTVFSHDYLGGYGLASDGTNLYVSNGTGAGSSLYTVDTTTGDPTLFTSIGGGLTLTYGLAVLGEGPTNGQQNPPGTNVPEPASMAIFAGAVAMLGARRLFGSRLT